MANQRNRLVVDRVLSRRTRKPKTAAINAMIQRLDAKTIEPTDLTVIHQDGFYWAKLYDSTDLEVIEIVDGAAWAIATDFEIQKFEIVAKIERPSCP